MLGCEAERVVGILDNLPGTVHFNGYRGEGRTIAIETAFAPSSQPSCTVERIARRGKMTRNVLWASEESMECAQAMSESSSNRLRMSYI